MPHDRSQRATRGGLSKRSWPKPLLLQLSLLPKITHRTRPPNRWRPVRSGMPTPEWRTLYKNLQRDWNNLVARAEEPDLPLPLMDGYDELIPHVRTLAAHPDLADRAREVLEGLLEYHDSETVARQTAEGYLASAERHVETYGALQREAEDRGVPVARLDAWPEWHEAAEMLAATGEAILSNEDRYGAYLEAITIGKARARLTVEQLRNRLRAGRVQAVAPTAGARDPKQRTEPTPKQEEEGFAYILDDPKKLRELREKAEKRDRKLGRHIRRSRGLNM